MTGPDENVLGRVLEPADLVRRGGGAGRLRVDVPTAWLEAGATVAIIVPERVACADCEGGGCDACQRSGAFRLGGGAVERTLQLSLPRRGPAQSVIRLVRPFGDDAVIEQLLVEVRTTAQASAFCRRVSAEKGRSTLRATLVLVGLLLAVAVLLAVVLGAGAH